MSAENSNHRFCFLVPKGYEIAAKASLITGLGFGLHRPEVDLRPPYERRGRKTTANLKEFRDHANSSGLVGTLVSDHIKKGATITPESFFISDPLFYGQQKCLRSDNARFFLDGLWGFALGFRDTTDQVIWLAGIGFTIPDKTDWLDTKSTSRPFSNAPLVLQIQACTQVGLRQGGIARSTLEQFRWEKTLLSLVTEWAARAKMPAVYVQPGERNEYVTDGRLPLKRAKLRYNTTAHRSDFIKTPQGLYALYFTY